MNPYENDARLSGMTMAQARAEIERARRISALVDQAVALRDGLARVAPEMAGEDYRYLSALLEESGAILHSARTGQHYAAAQADRLAAVQSVVDREAGVIEVPDFADGATVPLACIS